MTPTPHQYRPEIDGLRTVSVISVILYHAQFSWFGGKLFEGGFIGVDVFFVISGYLITRIIMSEIQQSGRFSIIHFYERRVRRIMPALFAVLVATIPFAWKWLLPSDFSDYTKSILATLAFGSNIFFYFANTEYGADSALLKPLLHTWSLGVEEQFYLFFPFLLLLLFKYLRSYLIHAIFILCIGSLLFAHFMESRNSDLNFYLPMSRFWELSSGAMLSLVDSKKKLTPRPRLGSALSFIGAGLIAYAIFSFDKSTSHPDFMTILPVIGVVLIIGHSSPSNTIGRILSTKPMVWIGLLSYSLYLWHFPIFAFSRIIIRDFSDDAKILGILFTFAAAILSYYLIERPCRSAEKFTPRIIWQGSFFMAATLATFSAVSVDTDGLWMRYSDTEQEVLRLVNEQEFRVMTPTDGSLGINERTDNPTPFCNKRTVDTSCREGSEYLVFLGDSFVGMLQRAFVGHIGDGAGFISFNYEQCPFIMDMDWYKNQARCAKTNAERITAITSMKSPRLFIISANVNSFAVPTNHKKKFPKWSTEEWEAYRKQQLDMAWKSYNDGIEWIASLGHRVVVVSGPPTPKLNSLKWLPANLHLVANGTFPVMVNDSDPDKLSNSAVVRYRPMKNVLFVDPSRYMCFSRYTNYEDKKCLDVHYNLGPMYNGDDHLSHNGALLVARGLREELMQRGWLPQ